MKCNVRGNVGPACNSAGLIDRSILGIEHLYKKPVYRNLEECQNSESAPSWCLAPFDPEGILGYNFMYLSSGHVTCKITKPSFVIFVTCLSTHSWIILYQYK